MLQIDLGRFDAVRARWPKRLPVVTTTYRIKSTRSETRPAVLMPASVPGPDEIPVVADGRVGVESGLERLGPGDADLGRHLGQGRVPLEGDRLPVGTIQRGSCLPNGRRRSQSRRDRLDGNRAGCA